MTKLIRILTAPKPQPPIQVTKDDILKWLNKGILSTKKRKAV